MSRGLERGLGQGADSHKKPRYSILIASLFTLMSTSSCVTEYSFEREVTPRSSFGTEVYQALHRDTRYSPRAPQARGALLERDRDRIITALDTIVTAERTSSLERLLRAATPLQELESTLGVIPQLTRALADHLEALSGEADALRVFASRLDRRGYQQTRLESGLAALLEYITSTPELSTLVERATSIILDHDGVDLEGAPNLSEQRIIPQLVTLVFETLRSLEVRDISDRLEVTLGDLLLMSDPRFQSDSRAPLWVTRLDPWGRALPARDSRGVLIPPFIDRDDDGLADRDTRDQLINYAGEVVDELAFTDLGEAGGLRRDELGRAVGPTGELVFSYLDLEQSALSYLVEQGRILLDREILSALIEVVRDLSPARLSALEGGETWARYPVYDNVWIELLYAGVQLSAFEGLDELLALGSELISTGEAELTELVWSLEQLSEALDRDPSATLTEGNALLDDLILELERLITPEDSSVLMADLMVAFTSPVISRCGGPLVELFDYSSERAVPPVEGEYDQCFAGCESSYELGSISRLECIRACPRGSVLGERLNRAAPPEQRARSHWERTLALFRTTSGLKYEMRVLELLIPGVTDDAQDLSTLLPPLLRIEDVAAAYIDTIAGRFKLVDYVTEEAIESEEVDVLIDGLYNICGSSALERFAQSLIPNLTRVTERDLERACSRLNEVADQTGVNVRDRKRAQVAVMVSFLSLLTDVGISEVPSASQMTRFFNTPNPSLDLNFARLSLSQIVDHDGYFLWEHHGDMLYAVEATGLLDVIQPLFEVFSRHKRSSELAALMSTLDQHYPTPQQVHLTAGGLPAPRSGLGTGLTRVEGALSVWLSDASPCAALSGVASRGEALESDRGLSGVMGRGRSLNQVIGEWTQHALQPDSRLTRRDGTSTYAHVSGAARPYSRVTLLLDALSTLSDRADQTPGVTAKLERAAEALYDQLLRVEGVGEEVQSNEGAQTPPRFTNRGMVALLERALSTLAHRARAERDEGLLVSAVRDDLYLTLEGWLTGRAFPLLLDLHRVIADQPEDSALFTSLAQRILSAEGRPALLLTAHELLIDLYGAQILEPLARSVGALAERPPTSPSPSLPFISLSALTVRELLERSSDDLVIEMVRSALRRLPVLSSSHDPRGASPLSALIGTLSDYHRVDPSVTTPITADDLMGFGREISRWLLDDTRGVERLYKLVNSRSRAEGSIE